MNVSTVATVSLQGHPNHCSVIAVQCVLLPASGHSVARAVQPCPQALPPLDGTGTHAEQDSSTGEEVKITIV